MKEETETLRFCNNERERKFFFFFEKCVWQQKKRRVTMRRVDKERGNIRRVHTKE